MRKLLILLLSFFAFGALAQEPINQVVIESSEIAVQKNFENSAYVKLKVKSIPIAKVAGLSDALSSISNYDDEELRDSIRLAFAEIDAIASGASDGVVTDGTFDQPNSEIDYTVAAPGSNFSVDVSGILNRANHTGAQSASTISDFDTEVSNNTDVAAATTHISNTSNPHSVTAAQVGSYTYAQADSIKQFVVDSMGLELEKLRMPIVTATSGTFSASDVNKKFLNESGSAVSRTIPLDFIDMEIGDQIIIIAGASDVDIVAASGVTLDGVAASSVTVSSPSGARVLLKIGDNQYRLL